MRVFVGDYEYCVEEGNEAEDVKEMLEEQTYETYAEQGATTNRTGPCFGLDRATDLGSENWSCFG